MIKQIKKFVYGPVFEDKYARMGREIIKFIKPYKRILDFGCGNMYLTKYFTDKLPKSDVIGIDVIDTNLTDLRPVIYRGGNLPFKDNQFDVAYVAFVLHHITNQDLALRELKRVAKRIVIYEEIYNNFFEKYITYFNDYTNRLESLTMNIPLNFRTDNEWKEIFKKLGLELVSEKLFDSYLFYKVTRQKIYFLTK